VESASTTITYHHPPPIAASHNNLNSSAFTGADSIDATTAAKAVSLCD
jgi:hypothetical protein